MAELADAHGSGPCESNFMQVQVLLPAPSENNPNLTPIGDGFGFFSFLSSHKYRLVTKNEMKNKIYSQILFLTNS